MAEPQPIGKDVTGFDILTRAVRDLLNEFPGLEGRKIYFEELGESDGIAFSADAGALVMAERRSITNHITQTCQYPFLVVYRITATREFQKLHAAAFLDALGKWICKEPVESSGEQVRLEKYPVLSEGRKIIRISRDNAYGSVPNENKSQDWILPVSIQYTNEFDMW